MVLSLEKRKGKKKACEEHLNHRKGKWLSPEHDTMISQLKMNVGLDSDTEDNEIKRGCDDLRDAARERERSVFKLTSSDTRWWQICVRVDRKRDFTTSGPRSDSARNTHTEEIFVLEVGSVKLPRLCIIGLNTTPASDTVSSVRSGALARDGFITCWVGSQEKSSFSQSPRGTQALCLCS